MIEAGSFLQELDDAVSRGSVESRLRALWHATDLLIAGRYTDEEIWVFGEVIGRLADGIEVAARAQLSRRLVRTDNASINIVKKLAFDDSIEVAGPMLQHCGRPDAKTLVSNIRSKSQSHLLAISKRNSLAIVVTDELVTRQPGSREFSRHKQWRSIFRLRLSPHDQTLGDRFNSRRATWSSEGYSQACFSTIDSQGVGRRKTKA